ncbi:Alpha/gamma-adaptin-binding protein p34 [Penicillium manginii]|uniref:Alpha/gamma-adaptin-binding protein p34 n=1 Tax=Penicillium manginii TaxID=203109 RepID=UPI002547E9E7|nr:Alpha/gamma-adaptin-binding protein p34 [Penicillium manginii]KAJ5756089.1 Alpha/gamma-adaptin-binding protein p34 [Penicillium manginii]
MPASTSAPSKPPAKNVPNPRRLLILTPPTQSPSIIPPLLHTLSGVPVADFPNTQPVPDPSKDKQQETQSQSKTQPEQPETETASEPTSPQPSFAGYTTHSPLRLSTKYYTAEVPIWVDEVPLLPAPKTTSTSTSTPDSSSGSAIWKNDFLSEEAQIVREAVGALVVAVRAPVPRKDASADVDVAQSEDFLALSALMCDIGAVKSCIDEERGGMDVPGVFLLVGAGGKSSPVSASASAQDPEDDVGDELGGRYTALSGVVVEWDPLGEEKEKTRNKFGEYEGMPRVKEVLETHDWSAAGEDGLDEDLEAELLGFDKEGGSGFGMEVNELEREMFGLRMAIERGGGDGESDGEEEEDKVESMESLIMRMQSLRDMGAELPDSERRKFAAKAVQDIMREL